MAELTDADRSLLRGRNYAHLVTLYADGTPQSTPLWVDADDHGHVLVNTAIGRVKERNVRRDPRVAVSVFAQDDPYRWLSVTGTVVELVTGEEAESHIDRLSRRYDGEAWTYQPGQRRVLLRIRPERIARSAKG
jgi:PPOX class probable F420-dependent enzyme